MAGASPCGGAGAGCPSREESIQGREPYDCAPGAAKPRAASPSTSIQSGPPAGGVKLARADRSMRPID